MPADTQPTRRQGRPPVLPHARERILDEAARLFAAHGYEGGSVTELAAAVGVSKAALYHYFPTKQDIYDALIVRVLQSLTDYVSDAVAGQSRAEARLRAFMLAHARYFEANHAQFLAMLIGYSGMGRQLRADAACLRDGYERALREIIADGTRDGRFADRDPAVAARAVLSMLNWMARWFRPGGGQSAEAVAADYYDLIVGGLRPAPPTTARSSIDGTG